MRELIVQALHDIAKSQQWDANKSCLILSGGLDSSIIAIVGKPILKLKAAFTVLTTPTCTDREYASSVATAAGLEHHVADITLEEILEEVPFCIKHLQTFDPMSVRNSIAISRALRDAAKQGFTCAVTGDGADELFGGYSFHCRLPADEWRVYADHLLEIMQFGSVTLGKALGLYVTSPFIQPAVIEASKRLSKSDCVAEVEPGIVHGKMPLRRAFPDVPTCWRRKDPIEVGCGTTELGDRPWVDNAPLGYLSHKYTDEEFEQRKQQVLKQQGVVIRDKEHLFYYEEFSRQFEGGVVPGKERYGTDPCPACGYQMSSTTQTFCVTCGHYDADLRKKR